MAGNKLCISMSSGSRPASPLCKAHKMIRISHAKRNTGIHAFGTQIPLSTKMSSTFLLF
eukprot:09302.XXX_109025_109201_1 [CDS] Oithona nana genome sequencing.